MSNADHALIPSVPASEAATVILSNPAAMLMPAHVAAVVPAEDHEVYCRLKLEQQKRISLLLKYFQDMATAPEGMVAAAERIARTDRYLAASSIMRLYYAFLNAEKERKGTGWLRLAKIYKGPRQLPPAFVQEVRRRIECNKVSARAAFTELRTLWGEGESIAGYGTWREYFRTMFPLEDVPERFPFGFYPPGWSERNLYEQQSSRAERALARHGYAAAKRYLPHVMRDLSQLRFMELVVIDDFETDQLVLAWNPDAKRWQIVRCAGLVAIDAATRTKLAIGLKPRWTSDEGKKQSLTRADVQTLLYEVFRAWGRPTAYNVTILCENGGAAISGDLELSLELLLGVQVARTGLIHEKTLRNGFVQSGGKPWEKPWIESMFRLMHSTAGALPGQKGATYQLKPADLEAKVLYAERLLNQEEITPEAAAQLKVPFLKVEEFLTAYERIFQRMEERDDHRLQGFEERFMFQVPGIAGLLPQSALDELPREIVLSSEPKQVMETPRERRERLLPAAGLRPVADVLLALMLLTPKKVKLQNHRLTFVHQGKGHTFADAESKVMALPEGAELLGYFDPARPGVLHVTDLQGNYQGLVRARGRVDIRDQAAIGAEQAEVSRLIHACVVGPVRQRHEGENQQLALDDAHNVRLQLEAGIAEPVRIAPQKVSPAAHSTPSGITAASAALTADKAAPGPKPERQGISHKLAQPPARDAFAAHRDALARGIAAEVTSQDARAALERQSRDDVNRLSADDIEAATGRRPIDEPATPGDGPFTSEQISDLLRD